MVTALLDSRFAVHAEAACCLFQVHVAALQVKGGGGGGGGEVGTPNYEVLYVPA